MLLSEFESQSQSNYVLLPEFKMKLTLIQYYWVVTDFVQGDKDLLLGPEKDKFVPPTPSYKETNDLVMLDSPDEGEGSEQGAWSLLDLPLERYFDTICDNDSFKVCIKIRCQSQLSIYVTYFWKSLRLSNFCFFSQSFFK